MKWFAQPLVAIVFGAFILCAETCQHFDSLTRLPASWPDLPLHDWIAGVFLVAAGAMSRRDWARRRQWLAVAWDFMLSLLVGAFFGHVADWVTPPPDVGEAWVSRGVFTSILLALTGVAFCALIATLTVRDT